jgi:hypothetical protein
MPLAVVYYLTFPRVIHLVTYAIFTMETLNHTFSALCLPQRYYNEAN